MQGCLTKQKNTIMQLWSLISENKMFKFNKSTMGGPVTGERFERKNI